MKFSYRNSSKNSAKLATTISMSTATKSLPACANSPLSCAIFPINTNNSYWFWFRFEIDRWNRPIRCRISAASSSIRWTCFSRAISRTTWRNPSRKPWKITKRKREWLSQRFRSWIVASVREKLKKDRLNALNKENASTIYKPNAEDPFDFSEDLERERRIVQLQLCEVNMLEVLSVLLSLCDCDWLCDWHVMMMTVLGSIDELFGLAALFDEAVSLWQLLPLTTSHRLCGEMGESCGRIN